MPTIVRRRKPRISKRRPTGNGFYQTRPWLRARARQLELKPLCEAHELAGKLIDCTEHSPVDHVVPIAHGGAGLDERNLMTLCERCHARKSAWENRKGCLVVIETCSVTGNKYAQPESKEKLLMALAQCAEI